MILQVSQISKSFGAENILENVSFNIENNEKAAIVGINGAGKSTLFKIIVGDLLQDDGNVILAKDVRLGYLAQHQTFASDSTIYDEILMMKQDVLDLEKRIRSLELAMQTATAEELETLMRQYTDANHAFEKENGYAYKSEITGVLKGLGFTEEEFDLNVNTLSGGQKTRVSLAKLLLSNPDIILLDEPTNHLDMTSVKWLETYLSNYKGAVVVISHDRYFINKIATKIIEIDNSRARVYDGNYDDFSEKKALIRKSEQNAYLKQQEEIKHQEAVIEKLKSFNREKSIKRAESREKALEKVELLDKPGADPKAINLKLTPNILSGNDVLKIDHLKKSYDDNVLFEDFSCLIRRGEKVALIGDNGTGKTTLLRILCGYTHADSGKVTLGAKVYAGYYDQEQLNLDMTKTAFDEIHDAYPDLSNTKVRNTLAAFLFTGDDVFKLNSELSGGERARVALAKLMLSKSNFLMLDEPTNHLDINSSEILEEAIRNYEGTVLYVSHDRYFINKTATRILDLTNKTFVDYDGDYDYYLNKKEIVENRLFSETETAEPKQVASEGKLDWAKQKELEAKKRKKASRISAIEAEIEKLETRSSEIDAEILKPDVSTNSYELNKLTKEQNEIEEKLLALMDEWEQVNAED